MNISLIFTSSNVHVSLLHLAPCIIFIIIIFVLQNPCPEVVSRLYEYLPNSEVTFEHHLLPLPTGSGAPHPQPKLDPFVSMSFCYFFTCI